MALKIEWSKNAEEHLTEILDYWEERNGTDTYSVKLFNLFQMELEGLTFYPEVGRLTDNHRVRKKIIKNYFLYYSFDDKILKVLAVVDMRRNPKFIRKFEESRITRP